MNSPQTYGGCGCLNDCQNIVYTFSESSRPILDRLKLCEHIVGVFGGFVKYDYSMDLSYKHYVTNDGPDPESYNDICEYLVKNYISVIKVEIGTKSVIKSIRDVKTTFETQLSAIGNHLEILKFGKFISLVMR